jgi:fructose-bisphosphate aldolase class 1
MATYRLNQPFHVRNSDEAPVPGHYELDVEVHGGRTLRRFVTDKGRAEILRRLDEGLDDITQDELDDLTVAPNMDALLERMDREAGEGA